MNHPLIVIFHLKEENLFLDPWYEPYLLLEDRTDTSFLCLLSTCNPTHISIYRMLVSCDCEWLAGGINSSRKLSYLLPLGLQATHQSSEPSLPCVSGKMVQAIDLRFNEESQGTYASLELEWPTFSPMSSAMLGKWLALTLVFCK